MPNNGNDCLGCCLSPWVCCCQGLPPAILRRRRLMHAISIPGSAGSWGYQRDISLFPSGISPLRADHRGVRVAVMGGVFHHFKKRPLVKLLRTVLTVGILGGVLLHVFTWHGGSITQGRPCISYWIYRCRNGLWKSWRNFAGNWPQRPSGFGNRYRRMKGGCSACRRVGGRAFPRFRPPMRT